MTQINDAVLPYPRIYTHPSGAGIRDWQIQSRRFSALYLYPAALYCVTKSGKVLRDSDSYSESDLFATEEHLTAAGYVAREPTKEEARRFRRYV